MDVVRPKFERPPLIEQAITVVFEDLDGFSIGDFGLFWSLIRDEFPKCEAQAIVESRIEKFDQFVPRGVQFQLVPQEALPRCFYRHTGGGELVQLQSDRFSFNWMHTPDSEYPHFEATVARFRELYQLFGKFVEDRELGPLKLRQCEITNVNIIPVKDLGRTFASAGKAFKIPQVKPPVEFLVLENYLIATQQLILNSEQSAVGRLHTSLAPVLRVGDQEHSYRLELTARGDPRCQNIDGVLEFFELGRSAINAAFMAATTKWAHSHWGEIHGDGL